MRPKRREMHLGVFVLGTGYHSAGWRYDGAATSNNDLTVIQEIARHAERGKFDKGLWGCREDGAIVADKATGVFIDPSKVRPLDHRPTRAARLSRVSSTRRRDGRT